MRSVVFCGMLCGSDFQAGLSSNKAVPKEQQVWTHYPHCLQKALESSGKHSSVHCLINSFTSVCVLHVMIPHPHSTSLSSDPTTTVCWSHNA